MFPWLVANLLLFHSTQMIQLGFPTGISIKFLVEQCPELSDLCRIQMREVVLFRRILRQVKQGNRFADLVQHIFPNGCPVGDLSFWNVLPRSLANAFHLDPLLDQVVPAGFAFTQHCID